MTAVDWLTVGGALEAWTRIGLVAEVDGAGPGGRVPLFGAGIHVTGGADDHGLVGWEWSGLDSALTEIDGVPTLVTAPAAPLYAKHPLGATRVDHVVLATNSLARTCGAIADATGAPLKRLREAGPMRQGFHRVGGLVIEVVERVGLAEGPASLWGLAICVEDLDAACAAIGDQNVGEPRDAVQPGRRIATIADGAGLGVPVVLMTD